MSLPLLNAGRVNPGLSAQLDLRFALDKSLTAYRGPTPSFSRASTGSYFDGSGVLRYAALNFLTYSEDFTNAVWLKTNSSISSNVATSPTGTLTADKLVENTAGPTTHVVTYNSATTGTLFSVYAKAGERGWIALQQSNPGRYCYFDLVNGVVGTASGATGSISSAGNGWYRCSILVPSGSSAWDIFISPSDNGAGYTGNGTSGIFIWGAQLEASSTVGTYCPTTTAANSAPRFDHTFNGTSWVSRGLLVEEQRVNIVLNSEDFNSWSLQGTTVTTNSTTAPDGATTADTIYETSTTGEHNRNQITTASTGTYTASFFVKYINRQWAAIYIYHPSLTRGHRAWFDIQNGVVGTTAAIGTGLTNVSTGIANCGNGWYRIWLTATTAATDLYSYFGCAETNGGSSSYAGNSANGYYVWGAQTELGSFPTSYIPTTSASVTRSADVCQITGSDFSGFWNGTEGSVAIEYDQSQYATGANNYAVAALSSGTALMAITSSLYGGSPSTYWQVYNGTAQAEIPFSMIQNGTAFKFAAAYKANDFAATQNGAAVGTDTSGSIPSGNQMSIGYFAGYGQYINGHISRIRYYNKRLPNATLQKLST